MTRSSFKEWKDLNLEFETCCRQHHDEEKNDLYDFAVACDDDGRRLYFAGGDLRHGGGSGVVDTFSCLNLEGNSTWTDLTPMPTPRSVCSARAIDDKVVVLGGRGSDGALVKTVASYDRNTAAWTELPPLELVPAHIEVAVLNNEEFIVVHNHLVDNIWEISFERYNLTRGSSEILTIPSIEHGDVRGIHAVNANKVLLFTRRPRKRVQPSVDSMDCELIDFSTMNVENYPKIAFDVRKPFMQLRCIQIDSFAIAMFRLYEMSRGCQIEFQIMDLDRPNLGWRLVEGLSLPWQSSQRVPKWLEYRAGDRMLFVGNLTTVKRLDMSPVFQVGTLKYKSLVSLIAQNKAPDGLIPYAVARGGTVERLQLTYELVKGCPELFQTGKARSSRGEQR